MFSWVAGCSHIFTFIAGATTTCAYAIERCHNEAPALRELTAGHRVRCHRAEELTLAGVAGGLH